MKKEAKFYTIAGLAKRLAVAKAGLGATLTPTEASVVAGEATPEFLAEEQARLEALTGQAEQDIKDLEAEQARDQWDAEERQFQIEMELASLRSLIQEQGWDPDDKERNAEIRLLQAKIERMIEDG